MDRLPDLSSLSHDEKDALIHALWAQVQALTAQVTTLTARVAELEAKLGVPPKTPGNSSLPPSQGKKPNRDDKPNRTGPRQGSLGREGGGRRLAASTRSTCRRSPRWSRGWSATPGTAAAAAAPPWRRCPRGWSRARRSA